MMTDEQVISQLLSRYFGAVDDGRLDLAVVESTFTPGGRLVRPNGSAMTGPHRILTEQARSFARFRATHHVSSDHLVDVVGDTARVRANLTAMHLWPGEDSGHFLAGGVLDGCALRTAVGWRLVELELRNVWRTGTGFEAMARTGAP